MKWTLPGTVLTGNRDDVDSSIRQIQGMFLAGGILRSQVSAVTGLEPHAIQNWVKRGFLSNPVNKHYSLNQFCRIVLIQMLKPAMPMERICTLLEYVNGKLSDESDDLIDDATLYFLFLRLAAQANHIGGERSWDEILPEILAPIPEKIPGAHDRIDRTLRVMLTAWIAVRTLQEAERQMLDLERIVIQKGE